MHGDIFESNNRIVMGYQNTFDFCPGGYFR
jgi:hypothetical protein